MTKQKKIVIKVQKKSGAAKKSKELTRLGGALRALGGLGGSVVGGLFGMPAAGKSVGTGLGASISKWLGSGDYEVSKNSLVSSLKASGSIPMMHRDGQSITVRHREFVTTVNSAQTFTVQESFDINPGNSRLFPWLSGIATQFQEYTIRGMVFHYVPSSGAAVSAANAALGTVIMQTSYRSSDSAPTSKFEMLNEYMSNECVPSEPFCHPIECDPRENPFNVQYVRSRDIASSEDKLLYDLGTTYIAMSGSQTTGNAVGDIWVTYEIELRKPVISSNITSSVKTATYYSSTGATSSGNMVNNASALKAGTITPTYSGNTITFPRGLTGSYQIWLVLAGSFNPLSMINTDTLVNCTRLANVTTNLGATNWATVKTGVVDTVTGVTFSTWINIPDPSLVATYTFPTPAALTGAITSVSVTVTEFSF